MKNMSLLKNMIDRIQADVSKYPGDPNNEESILVNIEGLNGSGHSVFSFQLGYSGTEEDWKSLVEVCCGHGEYILCHDDTDDMIHVFNEWVSFEIHPKYNIGHMSFTVPKTACIDAFRCVYDTIKKMKME